ncbi:MAG: BspA family leucine-rich repeat surface protein, partial [Marinifilaceae bacterium]|nr:BspA family leucine-rich repeat surface protein [Marinifilaceae bacterium]
MKANLSKIFILQFLFLFVSTAAISAVYQANEFVLVFRTTSLNPTVNIFVADNGPQPQGTGILYNYDIDWDNDGLFESIGNKGNASKNFSLPGDHIIRIRGDFWGTRYIDDDRKESAAMWIDILQWGNIRWKTMHGAFANTNLFKISASDIPITTDVQDMSYCFADAVHFNHDISNWDITNVKDLRYTFKNAKRFDKSISKWNTQSVTEVEGMFLNAESYNMPFDGNFANNLNSANNISNFSSFLSGAISFNQDLNCINLSGVINIDSFLKNASSYNHAFSVDFANKLKSVESFKSMFENAVEFNQDISVFDISAANTLEAMLKGAKAFDQKFSPSSKFISTMNQVNNLKDFLYDAKSFNDDIGCWNISNITNFENFLFGTASFTTDNYDKLLAAWSNKSCQDNIKIDIPASYNSVSEAARNKLINDHSWEISDLGLYDSSSFIFKIKIDEPNYEFTLYVSRRLKGINIVDWGDGSPFYEYDKSSSVTHKYTEAGVYTVISKGDYLPYCFGYLSDSNKEVVISIEQWGTNSHEMIRESFANFPNLAINAKDPLVVRGGLSRGLFRNSPKVDIDFTGYDFSQYDYFNYFLTGADSFSVENYDKLLKALYETAQNMMVLHASCKYSSEGKVYRDKLINEKDWIIYDNGENVATNLKIRIVIPEGGARFTFPALAQLSLTDYDIDWGDGNSNISLQDSIGHNYSSGGEYLLEIKGPVYGLNFDLLNSHPERREIEIDIQKWGQNKWYKMDNAFKGCTNLIISAEDTPDITNVTDLSHAFEMATNFNSNICNWDVSNVEKIDQMFKSATKFDQDISTWFFKNLKSMDQLFYNASSFNQDLSTWNTSQVKSFNQIFKNASSFNSMIEDWDVSAGESFIETFMNAKSFNRKISKWNTSSAKYMTSMFEGAIKYRQDISTWDISKVENFDNFMNGIENYYSFLYSKLLTEWSKIIVYENIDLYIPARYGKNDIDQRNYILNTKNWNLTDNGVARPLIMKFKTMAYNRVEIGVEKASNGIVYDFEIDWGDSTVERYTNDDLDKEGPSRIAHNYDEHGEYLVSISGSFPFIAQGVFGDTDYEVTEFSKSILEIVQWGDVMFFHLARSFRLCTNLIVTATDQPNISRSCSTYKLFEGCTNLTGDFSKWNMSDVGDASYMFRLCKKFNSDLSGWDLSNINNTRRMFDGCESFNSDISRWRLCKLRLADYMFNRCKNFNSEIKGWKSKNLGDIRYFLNDCENFNSPVTDFYFSHHCNVEGFFKGCKSFNQDVSDLKLYNSKNLKELFTSCYSFEGEGVENWRLDDVENIEYIFSLCYNFNGKVNDWNVSNVTSMAYSFLGCRKFNQDINEWDVSKVKKFKYFLNGAESFNQCLDNFNLISVTNSILENGYGMDGFLEGSGVSIPNYDKMLIAWSKLEGLQENYFSFDTQYHSIYAKEAIELLQSKKWTIYDRNIFTGAHDHNPNFNPHLNQLPESSNAKTNKLYPRTAQVINPDYFENINKKYLPDYTLRIIKTVKTGKLWLDINDDDLINGEDIQIFDNTDINSAQLTDYKLKYISNDDFNNDTIRFKNIGYMGESGEYELALDLFVKPNVSIEIDDSFNETDRNRFFKFYVNISRAISVPIEYKIKITDISTLKSEDYFFDMENQLISSKNQREEYTIQINGDQKDEDVEKFDIEICDIKHAFALEVKKTVSIVDDDSSPYLVETNYEIQETTFPGRNNVQILVDDDDSSDDDISISFVEAQTDFYTDDQRKIWNKLAIDTDLSGEYTEDIKLVISDGVNDIIQTIKLKVINYNEFPPVLEQPAIPVIEIFEDDFNNFLITKLNVTDLDYKTGSYEWHIENVDVGASGNSFSINPEGEVFFNGIANYENFSSLSAKAWVIDRLDNRLLKSDTVDINVSLKDKNEFKPEVIGRPRELYRLDEGMYTTKVKLNQISVKDADKTSNIVRWEITSQMNPPTIDVDYSDRISVNSAGEIFMQGEMDADLGMMAILFYLVAVDSIAGGVQKSRGFDLGIMLNQVNEFTPVISGPSDKIEITEDNFNSLNNIVTLQATDKDIGSNIGDWKITVGNIKDKTSNNDIFYINDGVLQCKGNLDAEHFYKNITLMINVSDGGTPEKIGKKIIQIVLLDKNEFTPNIVLDNKNNLIEDNYTSKYKLVELHANDQDRDSSVQNWRITDGNISDGSSDLFSIDQYGNIYIEGLVDRENIAANVKLTVCVDDGNEGDIKTGSMEISIPIIDRNEFKPSISIASNNPIPEGKYNTLTKIAKLSGMDNDATATFCNWQITEGNLSVDGNPLFSIDDDGNINIIGNLDYETQGGTIVLKITVDDGDSGTINTSEPKEVTISIEDVNDTKPEVVIDNDAIVPIEEKEYTSSTLVAAPTATDDDTGTSSFTNWQIVGGNPVVDGKPLFSIDKDTGKIYIEGKLDYEDCTDGKIKLQVTVDDGDTGTILTSEPQEIIIKVSDTNDNKPVIHIDSNTAINEGVYNTPHKFAVLSATDADVVSDFTNWQIVGGNPTVDSRKLFSINNSGEIFIEGELDNEAYTDAIVLE